jgi:hypothetical protein
MSWLTVAFVRGLRPTSSEWVLSGIHLDAQRPALQHLDLAALTASGPASGRSHGRSISISHHQPHHAAQIGDLRCTVSTVQMGCPRQDSNLRHTV